MANVRKLMRLAAEYEEHEGRDLRGFLEYAEERTLRDDREGMAAVRVEGHDGVRVMTVHAAKGLEFPVVAVADLGRGLGAGGSDGDVAIGRIEADPQATAAARREAGARARFGMRLPIAAAESLRLWELVELCEEERRAEIEEACRLVYVAVSRAEDRLILSGAFRSSDLEAPEEPKPAHSALKLLLPALVGRGWAGREGSVELERAPAIGGGPSRGPQPRLAVRVQEPSPERAAELCRTMPWPTPAADGAPPHRPAHLLEGFVPTAATGRLSYSALATYSGCGYRFYVERVIGLEAPTVRDQPAEDRGGEPPGPARSPLPPRGRASGRWRSATRCTLPSRRARDALGPRPAARSWRRSWRARGWTATVRPATGSRRWSRAGSPRSFARSSRQAARESGPRSRSCSGWGERSCAGRSTCWPSCPRAPWWSTTRPTPCGAPTRPSWRSATRRSATCTRSPSTGRAETGARRIVRAAYCFLEDPRARVGRDLRRGQGRGGARAPRAPRRGDPRRRLRAHRQPTPRALLRVPRGGAAVREARLAAPMGNLAGAGATRLGHEPSPGRVRLRVAGQPGERGANPGQTGGDAPARRAWPGGGGAGRRRATTCAPRRPSPSPTARPPPTASA